MASTTQKPNVPLSDAQLAEFAVNGLLVLPLTLPTHWLEGFYSKALGLTETEPDRSAIWKRIDPDVNAIAADPVLQGVGCSRLLSFPPLSFPPLFPR